MLSSFKNLTTFEKILWCFSLAFVILAFVLGRGEDYITLISSLIGVTALIFLAKGDVLGQILIIIFSILYAIISYNQKYYGEMITYVGMTLPSAILATITWIKNPYSKKEVEVGQLTIKKIFFLLISSIIATWIFYYILKYFNTASLIISTISVFTSFLACSLLILRSPYYALAYGCNDIVLIVLWIIASLKDKSSLPMVICFLVFLLNDVYGFISWSKMSHRQKLNN